MTRGMPELSQEGQIKLQVLMSCFFQQFLAFAEFMNDSNGLVETCKYADFILYAFAKDLREKFPDKLPHWNTRNNDRTCPTTSSFTQSQ